MVDEDAKHALEVRSVEDEEPVEALRARGADEALGDRVRFRRSNRRPDDLDAFASEDGVEVARVLAVAIADKEAKRRRSVSQCPGELAGLLGDPGAVWVGGAAGEVYAPAAELDVGSAGGASAARQCRLARFPPAAAPARFSVYRWVVRCCRGCGLRSGCAGLPSRLSSCNSFAMSSWRVGLRARSV